MYGGLSVFQVPSGSDAAGDTGEQVGERRIFRKHSAATQTPTVSKARSTLARMLKISFVAYRNAYILFVKERLPESRDLEPELPYRDLMRQIGTMWTNLNNDEKEV